MTYIRFIFSFLIPFLAFPALLFSQIENSSTRNAGNALSFEDCDEEITIHPQDDDFQAGFEGRVLISALHGGGYYTDYQIGDAQIKVEVLLPISYVGQTVYFRIVMPDEDDLSEYEPGNNTNPGDNLDGPGTLSSDQAVAGDDGRFVEGIAKAVADVTLNINNASGDDYTVEASLDPSFDKSYKTAKLYGWKRIYVEYDQMYRKGATLTLQHKVDLDDEDDILQVDNTSDFQIGDAIIVFTNRGREYDLEVLNKTTYTLTISDLNVPIHQYGGVKLASNSDVYEVSTQFVTQAFGANTDGSDEGAFVEFHTFSLAGSSICPKYHDFPDLFKINSYSSYWFNNFSNRSNIIYLVAAAKHIEGLEIYGRSVETSNWCFVFMETISNAASNNGIIDIVSGEVFVHEIGHQFEITNHHLDGQPSVPSWDGQDQCLMNWSNNPRNGITEFDGETNPEKNCYFTIRKYKDPM